METAISSVLYEVEGVKFKREVFASEPNQAIIVRIESSKKGALNFSVGFDSPHSNYEIFVNGNEIILKGKLN